MTAYELVDDGEGGQGIPGHVGRSEHKIAIKGLVNADRSDRSATTALGPSGYVLSVMLLCHDSCLREARVNKLLTPSRICSRVRPTVKKPLSNRSFISVWDTQPIPDCTALEYRARKAVVPVNLGVGCHRHLDGPPSGRVTRSCSRYHRHSAITASEADSGPEGTAGATATSRRQVRQQRRGAHPRRPARRDVLRYPRRGETGPAASHPGHPGRTRQPAWNRSSWPNTTR